MLGDFGKGIMKTDVIKDWRHAAHTFVDNNYSLSPKPSFIYHVAFDFGVFAAPLFEGAKKLELGMLAKRVSLPRFTPEIKTMNAYNRKELATTKVKYDSVKITMHDDNANTVYNMWREYFNYYYSDATHPERNYLDAHLYNNRTLENWGFNAVDFGAARLEPFFNYIRLYSLSRRQFTEYTLVRPMIKSCSFGDHNASSGQEMLSIDFDVEYETVLYRTGTVASGQVQGFAQLHYDGVPSPLSTIMGGMPNMLGTGGLFDTLGSISSDLEKGNIFGAAFKGIKTYGKFKDTNLTKMLVSEIAQVGMDILRPNPKSGVDIPVSSSVSGTIRGAIASPIRSIKNAASRGVQSIVSSNRVSSNGQSVNTEKNIWD